jgi:hypothetical protein
MTPRPCLEYHAFEEPYERFHFFHPVYEKEMYGLQPFEIPDKLLYTGIVNPLLGE